MKNVIRSRPFARQSGFSLVEMIGVLAIIAILAVVIVPKVFSTIASSRITNAVGSVTSMKSAVSDFAGKYGTIPLSTATSRIDDLLVTTGFLDNRFVVKIGNQPSNPRIAGDAWTQVAGVWTPNAAGASQATESEVISLLSTAGVPSASAGTNYRLDGGATAASNLPVNSRVVSAVIRNATIIEARELSSRIDGDALSNVLGSAAADNAGKVVYAAPVAGLTTVYVYIAHQ